MAAYLAPIWDNYLAHRSLDSLREDILTYPWYQPPEKADESLLLRAIQGRDAGAAVLLIAMGESPLLPASDGFTLLHTAVDAVSHAEIGLKRDSVEIAPRVDAALAVLRALLDGGADPNVMGADGTPLHRAAGSGIVESARMLLAYGADIEARMLIDGELTPLLHAAMMGQPQMVRFLLDSGANRSAMSRTSLRSGASTSVGKCEDC